MGVPSRWYAAGTTILNYAKIAATGLPIASPAMAAPVTTPMPPVPAPMAAAPAPMTPMAPMPSPVPVMSPAHLFRPELIDIVLRDDRGFRALAARRQEALLWRNRRQRRRLRARSKRRRACNKSKGEFQKVAAFHDISSLAGGA
jgi:hypothetical protein